MSGIGAVVPADNPMPIEEHRPGARDGKRPPRQPPKSSRDEEMVETEPHKLDVET